MLPFHRFRCLPLFPRPRTLPCSRVLANPDDLDTCTCHFNFRFFTVVIRASYGPVACLMGSWNSSLVMCVFVRDEKDFLKYVITIASIFWCSSAVRVHISHAQRKMEMTRERISRMSELMVMLLSVRMGFSFVNAAVVWALLAGTSGFELSSEIMKPRCWNFWTACKLFGSWSWCQWQCYWYCWGHQFGILCTDLHAPHFYYM